jgi:hypothetical protein
LAEEHLKRVQAAWDDPTDWEDLTMYGLYCVEAAVVAAAKHFQTQGLTESSGQGESLVERAPVFIDASSHPRPARPRGVDENSRGPLSVR